MSESEENSLDDKFEIEKEMYSSIINATKGQEILTLCSNFGPM